MTESNRALTIKGLLALGWKRELAAKSRKYEVYSDWSSGQFCFVGRSGALRHGKTISGSVSFTGNSWHKALIEVGRRSGSYSSVEQARADLGELLR